MQRPSYFTNRPNQLPSAIIIFVALIMGGLFTETESRLRASTTTVSNQQKDPYANRIIAPKLDTGSDWLNVAGPIRLQDLRGKVVVLDFWTYCCINCIHMLPTLKKLEEKYPNEVVVIGVHSAKFTTEKETDNIRQAILRYEISHPVINDSEFLLWRKYQVSSWPSLRVIDPEGYVVGGHSGELPFVNLDQYVTTLIKHHRDKGTLDERPVHFELERFDSKPQALNFPGKVLADERSKRLFITDSNNNRIVITDLEGSLIDVIGSGVIGSGDGSFTQCSFDHPQGLALDDRFLYISDTENHMLRKADLTTRQVTTIAGIGEQASFGSGGGLALKTALNSPWDLELVEQNGKKRLFIAMAGPHQIWSMNLQTNRIHPYAGSGREDILDGSLKEAALAQPSSITIGKSNGKSVLYVADSEGSALRTVSLVPGGKVKTVVGPRGLPNGRSLFEFADRDGIGAAVRLQHPLGVAYYKDVLYIADTYNNKIKTVHPVTTQAETFLGDGEPGKRNDPPRFDEPGGLSAADNRLFIADTNNHRIQVVDLIEKKVGTLRIKGLRPPNRKNAITTTFPQATTQTLPVQNIRAANELVFQVQMELPLGFKINPDVPIRYLVQSDTDSGVVNLASFKELQTQTRPDNPFDIHLPLHANSGKETLRVSMTYYYCREGGEGFCHIKSAIWTIPIQVSPTGSDAPVTLTTTTADQIDKRKAVK